MRNSGCLLAFLHDKECEHIHLLSLYGFRELFLCFLRHHYLCKKGCNLRNLHKYWPGFCWRHLVSFFVQTFFLMLSIFTMEHHKHNFSFGNHFHVNVIPLCCLLVLEGLKSPLLAYYSEFL